MFMNKNIKKYIAQYPKRFAAIFYFIIILVSFSAIFTGNKSLFPFTVFRSTDTTLLAGNIADFIEHGGVYQDDAATDIIEAPFVSVINRLITDGEIPLWDPYNSLGMPLIHNTNNSMLAPLQWIPILWNSEGMWEVMFMFRVWIIMFGTFLLCDHMKIGFEESCAAGVFIGLSGYVMTFLNIFFLHVDAFLPLLIYFSLKYLEYKKISSWLCSLLCIVAMSLGGNPQNLAINCLFCLIILLGKVWKKVGVKTWILYLLTYPVSIVLTLYYWLPFVIGYKEAYIARNMSGASMGTLTKSLFELLGLLWPGFSFDKYLKMIMPYIGISVLCLILFQLRFQRNKRIKITLIIYVLLFLEKIRGSLFLNWIGELPVLSQFNFTKYNFSMYLAIAILGAFAIQDFSMEKSKIRNSLTYLSLLIIWGGYFYQYITYKNVTGGVYLVCIIAVMFIILSIVSRNLKKKKIFLIGVACLELIGLSIHMNNFRIEKGYSLDEPECVSALKRMDQILYPNTSNEKSRTFCVGKVFLGNTLSYWGIENISGISATPIRNYFEFMKTLVLNDKVDIQWVSTSSTEYAPRSRPILNLLGTRYLIIDDYGSIEDENLILIYDSGRLKIYWNPLAFKRCFTVHNVQYLDSKEDIFNFLSDEQTNLALVATIPSNYQFEMSQEPNSIKDSVELVKYKGNKVTIKCSMGSDGLLILSDLDFPGWNVYINGKKGEIVTADYILRGVYLKAGDYKIEFRYEPPEVYLGLGISILSAITLGVLLAQIQKRTRNQTGGI